MNCERVLDKVYEFSGGPDMPLITRVRVGMHLLVCPDCVQEVERFEVCRDMLSSEFLPPAPVLEDAVMAMIAEEPEAPETAAGTVLAGGFSTRSWVIAGLVMLVSLATVFLGLDFNKVAVAFGMWFMIPIGITIGIALTCYGAFFVSSHLKELSERFGL